MPVEPLDCIQSLLKRVTSLREDCLHSPAENAPNFNLFRILDVEEKEVSTHSAFLAHLLTPGEAHAQGDLFLRKFLSELRHEKLASFDGWTVSKELPFVGGRLDIVLQSAKASAIIVVENKIGTEDHADQLKDYRSWLNEPRRRSFETRLLFYLTPAGDLAKNARRNIYEPISYAEHISRWLRSCLGEVKPPRVKEAIKTYLQTISNLNTDTLMKDDLDIKILSQIKTPADQTAALRIARVREPLKEMILQKFWDKGTDYLKKKLADEKLTYWSLDRAKGSTLQSRYWIALAVRGLGEEKPHARFSFFQFNTTTLFRWELAVKFGDWRGKNEEIMALPDAQKLAAVMDGTFSMPKKHGWDGYCLYTDDSKGIERILEEEIQKRADVSDFFEAGWKKFQGLEPHLRRLNNVMLRQVR